MPPDLPSLHHEIALRDPFAWAGLAGIVGWAYLTAMVVTWLSTCVALSGWRRAPGKPWVERARLSWPARRIAGLAWLVTAIALSVPILREQLDSELIAPGWTSVLAAIASIIGGSQASIAWGRRLNPAWAMTQRPARGAWAILFALLVPPLILGTILFQVAPRAWDTLSWVLIGSGTAALGGYLVWGWPIVMRWLGALRPAGERLQAIAERSAERAGVVPRSVLEMSVPMANAFALVQNRSVAVTDATLAILNDDELAAILAHEMAHLAEPAAIRALRSSYVFFFGLYLATSLVVTPAMRSLSAEVILLTGPCGLVLLLVVRGLFVRLSHRLEVRADAIVKQSDIVPGTYARALAKIYEANLAPVVLGTRRHTHPDLHDRLIAAGVRPEYWRPAPPPGGPWLAGLVVMILGAAAGAYALSWMAQFF